jgi:hypothetical protein
MAKWTTKIMNFLKQDGDLKWILLLLTVALIILGMYFYQMVIAAIPVLPIQKVTTVPAEPIIVVATVTEIQKVEINYERCVPASEIQFANITDGLLVETQAYINSAWAVKSGDYENVWMVAAVLYGPGMEEGTEPAVWAMNGDTDEQGMINAVNSLASRISYYPNGAETDANLSIDDNGVQEAIDCANAEIGR